MRNPWVLSGAIGATLLVVVAIGATRFSSQDSQVPSPEVLSGVQPTGTSAVQPIAFPHDLHVEEFQIDCQYCHFSAERSVDAGMPSVDVCMGCHSDNGVPGRTNPGEIEKLREYADAGEPIPWVRIYKIADHAHFPHMRHVNAGLDCTQCHGPVSEMGPIEAPDPAWGGKNMGWCVTCHVELEVRRDCTVCHY